LYRTTALRISRALAALAATLALAFASAPAAAQGLCEEQDAGVCEDDGGVDAPPDAGEGDAGSRADGGGIGRDAGSGSAGEGVACSCHTESEAERGARIHVCTQSFDPEVCRAFDCERGAVRSRACPSEHVRLCCEMPSRGLSTSLYEDCSHPNCESGFREQCREFGGSVSVGPCESSDGGVGPGGGDVGDSGGGMCAVRAVPGASAGGSAGRLLPLCALALLALRVSRRVPARRARRPAPPPRPA
jgi:hypothetical protein